MKKTKPTRPSVDMFIAEYIRTGNGKQAAISAGYSPKTADQQASRLLKNVKVRQAIDSNRAEAVATAVRETGVTLERVLREIAKGAFFDVRKLFHPNGQPRDICDLDDDTASVLAGLDVLEEHRGTGEEREFVGYVKKYKLADRKGYLDMLMKHLGGYAKDHEETVTVKQEAAEPNEVARRMAYMLHRGLQAANDPKSSNPRQAAS
jgi:phage terminase small subunit